MGELARFPLQLGSESVLNGAEEYSAKLVKISGDSSVATALSE